MPDPIIRAHQEWLGLVQPVGLVVAPSALENASIVLDASDKARWLAYDSILTERDGERVLRSFDDLITAFLEWPAELVAGRTAADPVPDELVVSLPELEDRLEPTYAVRDAHSPNHWLMLVRVEAPGTDLDHVAVDGHSRGWHATPHERFERLLRDTKVPIGLLATDQTIRLVYAPSGESSGHLSFPVAAMARPADRRMLMAMYELLKGWRLSAACPSNRTLWAVLEDSRRYQNVVSTRLAEQVLGALYELTRGFQAADDAAHGGVVQETLSNARKDVYGGFLTTIMRLVFVLYAEERGMLPQDSAWVEHYGVGSLFARLRADRARYPDTMDQRFGAWPRLLSLARILHDGAHHGAIAIPARAGDLFDPDLYPFLEGRPWGTRRSMVERLTNVPRVSDGTILRVLDRLLMLDGERISYRALDVEQIGSVYEAMMGFDVRQAHGLSIAVKPKTKKAGSPSHEVVNLDELLAQASGTRAKWLKETADCELSPRDAASLRDATTIDAVIAALASRRSPFTPQPIQLGGMVLVPTEERRRSGSHYTPRELTEPIVITTLRPVLERLGPVVTTDQLLQLRICDPAMGSGAFLVGACRYLGERVVESWQRAGGMPSIPPDEDPELYARRLVAQRCLFGVDRNPFAVQLAKLSLWLVTLARDHPFTFLDHALRNGDSLVGLTRRQLAAFHWDLRAQPSLILPAIEDHVNSALGARLQIEGMADSDNTSEKVRLLHDADSELTAARHIGDAAVSAFFSVEKPKAREAERQRREEQVLGWLNNPDPEGLPREWAEDLRAAEPPLIPFHWEIEFPEVFVRENPGFDAIVGNPPFAGKNTLINSNPEHYLDWLQTIHAGAHGNSDLVAHFFRRAYGLLRDGGAFGLIATNTIAQGDTRATGLRWLRHHGVTLYEARRRNRWPGAAAVVVSVVHGVRGAYSGPCVLDGRAVGLITAFLFHAGSDDDPAPLPENAGKSFQGSIILGMGFTFDDDNEEATPIAEMERLISENPRNAEVIFPLIGGEELNDSPARGSRRYVINFGEMSEGEARDGWPELMRIVEQRVRPGREQDNRESYRRYWWQFAEKRLALQAATVGLPRLLGIARVSNAFAFTYLQRPVVASDKVIVLTFDTAGAFCLVQSRVHESWTRFLSTTLKDDLQYTPSVCFETFPFPERWDARPRLDEIGAEYVEYRGRLMVANDEGLTAIYNRFHDANEADASIVHLRQLHERMDRAVLDAYGWHDIRPRCEFLLEYEDEEDDAPTRRRKPWRYRWPDEVREEVLARLLELNRERSC